MSDKAQKINHIIEELSVKRTQIEHLEARTKTVIAEIEQKLLSYLQKSTNLPSVGVVTPITESLTSLYNINLNANSQLIRSLEKEIELIAKHGPDEKGEIPQSLTYDVLGQLMQNSLNRAIVDDEEE